MLIVCDSAISWISDELINGKDGLYDRVTAENAEKIIRHSV